MWLLALGFALLVTVWLWPLQVRLQLGAEETSALLQIQIRGPFPKLQREINLSEIVRTAVEHMWKRWQSTGEPVKVPLQKTVRRIPRAHLIGVASPPLRYLGRRTLCRRLEVEAHIGGRDAMESALLAAGSWALLGTGVTWLSQCLKIDQKPRIHIQPEFSAPAWSLRADCILRFRAGNALITGIWLVRRVLLDREVYAWIRDSLRRKGEETDVGTSD